VDHPGFLSAADLAESIDGVDGAVFRNARVLVTGAGGCLGGAIAEALLALRRGGVPLEVLAAGRDVAALRRHFGDAARLVPLDLARPVVLPDDLRPTMAVHAASPASPRDYLARPVDTLQINAAGITAIASALPRGARMLYFSSGEIYGSPASAHVPTPESYAAASDPLSERACYVEAKRHGEALMAAWQRQHGLHALIARPIHVYGPGLRPDDGRVICDFVANAIAGRPIRMLSDGSPRRSFCYLSDATRLLLRILASGAAGEAWNVGRDAPLISIAELAAQVAQAVAPVAIERGQAAHATGSPQQSCPDMAKARRDFAYAPRIALDEGLRRLAASFREKRHAG